MKNFLSMVGGFCASAVGCMVWNPRRTEPLPTLARRLEQAWAHNHTIV
jgi:hypothetical protein